MLYLYCVKVEVGGNVGQGFKLKLAVKQDSQLLP